MENMKILIVYATNSGGTQLAAQIVQETLVKHSLTAELKEVRDTSADEFAGYDLVILSSPSWDDEGAEGQPHPDWRPFMEKAKGKDMSGKKFAVIGLGDSSYTYFCGAVKILEDFIKSLKGELLTESLKIDGFYLDQQKSSLQLTDWTDNLASRLQGAS
ncbi:hypothetical protein A3J20_03135 [Candidatus Gottesmanbacteria bacterium RIFCSPLOWO2_02_FULL_42_29]|uniref:Flavodoxin-like domain-containing protein n=2 Tax=Candidatus Gottesmaniibacteriota TaxID=1752720 RepID=A0A1F6B884_9BACT|nr:MAG: Flavodoxin [Candidatus Gottesmanbacteria bacterium GW2011_GWA2_42_18]KKS73341.1 MAG: Flavodoxin [Candidatus Gottesmanbacteria bacterium GW2011_GWC2_42_8]OGG32952.1 MAG: hypothetical protein A2968_06820 [Candidatus Gottesmanbacteria bacterium RIFCSPLOWO2_01_FULL_42_22]OGG36961.1 MAG: hypothetical protein A3J20_03135 [Candidatus Gottesmanbacteria bacterium RIFCSPLOWO2_02_FULL_42_29]